MIVVILAAGYGTRLYPLTKETPKALLPVKGKPILQYLLEKLTSPLAPELESQTKKLLLVSNHRYAEAFQEWLSKVPLAFPMEVLDDGSTSEENRLGSIGDLSFAIRHLEETKGWKEDLLVLGSDNLFPDRLGSFVSFAQGKGSKGSTLGIYELPDRSQAHRYGVVRVDGENHHILEFQEKPKDPASASVSTAIYYFPYPALKWVLEYVSSHATADALGSFVHWLLSRQSIFAYRFDGPWFDIGDVTSYTNAQENFC